MRVFVVVGRTGSPTNDGAMPASRQASVSVAAASSRPVTATSVDLAAERDDIVRDVGGAAHAVHVVIERDDRDRGFRRNARHAADDELVDHGVADDEDVHAAHARRRSRARVQARVAVAASSRRAAANGKRDEHEEEHQELGVAEVVLEETGGEHAGDGGEAGRGRTSDRRSDRKMRNRL